jgi:hypothetical protein
MVVSLEMMLSSGTTRSLLMMGAGTTPATPTLPVAVLVVISLLMMGAGPTPATPALLVAVLGWFEVAVSLLVRGRFEVVVSLLVMGAAAPATSTLLLVVVLGWFEVVLVSLLVVMGAATPSAMPTPLLVVALRRLLYLVLMIFGLVKRFDGEFPNYFFIQS